MMANNAIAQKKTKKATSLKAKIHILHHLAAGEGSTAVGKYFGLNEATVRTMKRNEEAIRSVLVRTKCKIIICERYYKSENKKALVMWNEDRQKRCH